MRRRYNSQKIYCPICKEDRDVRMKKTSNIKNPKKIWVLCAFCGRKGFVTLKEPNKLVFQSFIIAPPYFQGTTPW